jgi:hypothetical protein
VNVDEFEHTEVEQQARRDQQRVLAAMARRDPEVQREGNDATQAAFQSPTAHDDVTTGSPPTHPAQLSDGGGTDVGGVGSHQTQDIGTETSPSTASQASTTLAAGAGGSMEGWRRCDSHR